MMDEEESRIALLARITFMGGTRLNFYLDNVPYDVRAVLGMPSKMEKWRSLEWYCTVRDDGIFDRELLRMEN